MDLTLTDIGLAGEHLFCARVILTGGGGLSVLRPDSDQDHADVLAGRHGGPLPRLALQVKTCRKLNKNGVVDARASFPIAQGPADDPALVYVILFVPRFDIERSWVLPSHDFNRVAYRSTSRRGHRISLSVRIHVDRLDVFTPFEVPPDKLGPRIAALVGPESLPPSNPPPTGSLFLFMKGG